MSGGTTGTVAADLLHAVGPRGRRAAHGAGAVHAGHPPRRRRAQLLVYGTHNGAWVFDEALYRWLNCVVLTTGTGNVTSSEQQVELAIEYGATAILTTGDYLLRLADVAREHGLRPDDRLQASARCPTSATASCSSRRSASSASSRTASTRCSGCRWSARRTTGCTSSKTRSSCRSSTPRPASRSPTASWARSCITELYKTGSPQFRYNIMDLSYLYPREQCACGSWLRKMAPFAGRGDNMVKLRGHQRVARGGRRHRDGSSTAPRPTTSCAPCARTTATR